MTTAQTETAIKSIIFAGALIGVWYYGGTPTAAVFLFGAVLSGVLLAMSK